MNLKIGDRVILKHEPGVWQVINLPGVSSVFPDDYEAVEVESDSEGLIHPRMVQKVLPDSCEKLESEPCMLPDDHPVRRMGDLGNQVHNLGCELQNDEGISDELGEISLRLWDLERQLRIRTKVERERENLAKVINDAYVRADKWQVSYLDVADAILAAGFTKPD